MKYGLNKSWNVKVNCEIDILDKRINFLKAKDILAKDWERNNDAYISMLLMKKYIKNQTYFMNNKDEKNR